MHTLRRAGFIVRGDDDDRQGDGMRAQSFHDIEAAHLRHVQIEHEAVEGE